MKPQTITLTHLPGILLVVVPEGAAKPRIFPDTKEPLVLFDHPDGWDGISGIDLPQGNWRIVSALADVTEEWCRGVIKGYGKVNGFHNYESTEQWTELLKRTALESFHSAIVASGYYIGHNPLGKEKEHKKKYKGHDMFFADHIVKWHKAQSRTLPIERTLILEKT